jgi:hypothetical protein|tara:strand:- start:195 stop:791 length:597 start_codon:yes stop_codon:yes gene_type:complete
MAKLKNIKAVKEMLGGEHKTQTKKTISFADKVFVKKEVGETWIDDKNQKWEQRNGYKVKVGKLSKLREELKEFPNCNTKNSSCNCTNPGQADLKMKAIHGMCLNCVVEMEHELKLKGEYKEYERKKLLANAEAWLKQAEVEKDILKSTLKASYVNEDGSIEDWGEGMSEKQLVEKIDNGFEKFKENFIDKLKNEQKTD